MTRKVATVLGISPGTRSLGIAILRDGDLVDWRLRTFKGAWSKLKLRIIMRLLVKHIEGQSITAIALKNIPSFRSSKGLAALLTEIGKFENVKSYTIGDIQEYLLKSSNRPLSDWVISNYPETFKEAKHSNEAKKMNEAIVLAHIEAIKDGHEFKARR